MLWLILLGVLLCGFALWVLVSGWFGSWIGDLVKKGFESWDGL